MELGGHAPLIIAEDADLDVAVSQTIASNLEMLVKHVYAPTA